MTTALTSSGFTGSTYAELIAEMTADSEGVWGESVDTSPTQLLGHFMRLTGLSLAEIIEALQDVVDVLDSQGASCDRLDHLFALVGLERQSAVKSTVTLTYTATKACTVEAGHQTQTGANVIFETDTALVFTAAGSDTVAATCTEYGAYNAAIGEVNTLVTSVDGISGVTNAAAATPGRLRAEDPEFRATHTATVATSGEHDLATIYEALSETDATYYYAEEDDTNHSISVAAIGGTDAEIAEAIANNIVGAVPTVGTTSVSHYSTTTGQSKTINFYRATDKSFYVDLTINVNESLFPDDGDVQLKAALVAFADTLGIKDTVNYYELMTPIYTIAGVTVQNLYIAWTASPTGTSNLTTTILNRPDLVAANISITHV